LDVPEFLQNFDLHNWQEWAAPLAGVASGLMALFMGHAWLRSRQRRAMRPPAEKPGQIKLDPFLYGSANEKRIAQRRTGQPTKVTISPQGEKDSVQGWVVDRSVGGLCLMVDDPIPENTILDVRANHAPPETPWVKVEVKRCQATRDHYELGCQFVTTPTWNLLLLFG
jgi:hypothetical protein